ncbi:MAG TPA: M48 family metallopeptidase [Candidatus Polarisedimenticolaceae bacterium]|nr:M48 family metallopeptidase [Candidatus Polarisedimenticolaceae bacterium]
MTRRIVLIGLLLVFVGTLVAAAPPPAPETAPHGIANQASDEKRDDAHATGPVAVPEPSEKAREYARSGNWLWGFDQIWGLLVPGVILFTGFSARLRDAAGRIGKKWYFTILVYFVLFLGITFLIDLPLSYYTGFVRPHAYGLSDQAFSKWIGDEIKGIAVGVVFGAMFLWIPYLIVKKSPRRWWLWDSLIAIPIAIFILLVEPIAVEPLFNKFGPMHDKALEQQILNLASRAGIEGARVFEVDKSTDTNTVNAYVTGLGSSKRIVLWDTTIKKLAPDQLLFVMGHEMGHYVLGHVWKSILFFSVLILVTLYAAYRLQAGLIARWHDRFRFSELSDIASLPLVMILVGVISFVITPVGAGYSRWQEHEADRFGLEITQNNHACATAFVRLQEENLSVPRRSLLYKLWRADHPLLGERIDFCNDYHPWTENQPGRYEHLFH